VSNEGLVMARRAATIIIEPHLLVREALESLIKNYRYRVVCSVGSTADISDAKIAGDGPKLVILGGAESTDKAVTEAVSIRKLWSDTKIVLLFEHASVADFQKLLTSEVDGCVPLFASPETLIRTLDLVTIEDARVVVTASAKHSAIRPTPEGKSRQPQVETDKSPAESTESEKPVTVVPMHPTRQTMIGYNASLNGDEDETQWTPTLRNSPRLSEREAQILDGLVRGHANKVIARSCDITEATVKVHMKSILRKIQVENRTQAAVWALEHGHSADAIKDAC
jgi:two-component system nitrate/nitrite response regulator NarL